MNPPPAPERLRDLARKLRALMDDPAATEGERTAARDRLRALMAKHNLTEDQLLSEEQVSVMLWYDHKADHMILVNLAGTILETCKVRYHSDEKHRWFSVSCTPAQRADLLEAWEHYRPILHQARILAETERKRLRARLRTFDKDTASTFIHKFHLFPENAPTDSRPLTPDQIRRILDARALMADLEGDRWQRKAGHLDTPTLQLHG